MATEDYQKLISTLNNMIKKEKWKKMPKYSGEIQTIKKIKSGNIRIDINSKNSNKTIYLLQKNQKLFATALLLKAGDNISITARQYLGKAYCTKITKVTKRTTEDSSTDQPTLL